MNTRLLHVERGVRHCRELPHYVMMAKYDSQLCACNHYIPITIYQSLYTNHYSLYTNHYIPITIYQSLYTNHYNYTNHHIPITIYQSPYTNHHIPITIYQSPYTNHYNYTNHYIPITIHYIPITIYQSPYTNHHIPITIIIPITIYQSPYTNHYIPIAIYHGRATVATTVEEERRTCLLDQLAYRRRLHMPHSKSSQHVCLLSRRHYRALTMIQASTGHLVMLSVVNRIRCNDSPGWRM